MAKRENLGMFRFCDVVRKEQSWTRNVSAPAKNSRL